MNSTHKIQAKESKLQRSVSWRPELIAHSKGTLISDPQIGFDIFLRKYEPPYINKKVPPQIQISYAFVKT
jgi:hypothetical protein